MMLAPAFGQTVKKVVIEEKTGTWCGFCPSGTVAMEDLTTSEPNSIGIAIHDSDPMENTYYNGASDALPLFGGYPYAAADRANVGGTWATYDGHAAVMGEAFNVREGETPAASIAVGANYVAGDGKIYVDIQIVMDSDESGDWRLAAVLVEDNVTGTSSGYAQANYFAGGGYGNLDGAGHDWDAETNPIPAANMEYDHVARKVANDQWEGDAGSLPSTLDAGATYGYSYEITKQSTWDENNLKVVAMLVQPDGTINNANSVGVTPATSSIEEIENDFGMLVYPNPATTEATVRVTLDEAADVTIEIFNVLGERVFVDSKLNMSPETYLYSIDVDGMSAGVYTVKTTVNNTIKTEKLSVR